MADNTAGVAPEAPDADTPTPKNSGQPPTAADASYKLCLALIAAGKLPAGVGAVDAAWEIATVHTALTTYFATGRLPNSPDAFAAAAAAARRKAIADRAAEKLSDAGPAQ